MISFVKNTFSPLDVLVLVKVINNFLNVLNFSRGFKKNIKKNSKNQQPKIWILYFLKIQFLKMVLI